MLKKIFKDKFLLTSIISCLLALIALASAGFAWLAISSAVKADSFVGSVGDCEVNYQFGKVIDNNVNVDDSFNTEETMPGDENTFLMIVENEGDSNARVDVYFFDVYSQIYALNTETQTYEFSTIYANLYEKIQYSYSYTVDLVAYIPPNTDLSTQYGGDLEIPTVQETIENGWEEISRSEEKTYFNKVNLDDNSQYESDVKNYDICSSVDLTSRKNDQAHCAIVIYFTVYFESLPLVPSVIDVPEGYIHDSNIYINQRFYVSNVIIDAKQVS